MTEIEPIDWEARLRAAVAETIRKRQERRDEREARAARRDAGLVQRHGRKLARAEAAAVVPAPDGRCHYAVGEQQLCPVPALAGGTLCRPHVTTAVALARQAGLIQEGERL